MRPRLPAIFLALLSLGALAFFASRAKPVTPTPADRARAALALATAAHRQAINDAFSKRLADRRKRRTSLRPVARRVSVCPVRGGGCDCGCLAGTACSCASPTRATLAPLVAFTPARAFAPSFVSATGGPGFVWGGPRPGGMPMGGCGPGG